MQPRKEMIEKTVLMIPLFAAFVWMGYVVIGSGNAASGMMLAPSRLESLVTALFIFILIYSVVLLFLFLKMNKGMKPKKKAKKKQSLK